MRKTIFILLFLAATFPLTADDVRLAEPLTLHGYHPFRPVDSAEAWETRKKDISDRVLLGCGLLPLPEKTPLNAKRFGRLEQDGFAVEKVYFESIPGHYVTASLYTPTGESLKVGEKNGKRPAVLCPHGHWKEGRFYDIAEPAVNNLIANGGERFANSARNPIQARCVQLARMGCVVLQYDMLGNADSKQLEEHRRGPRPKMNSAREGEWGFVSPQATLRLQTNFGLQTWNSIRALDYVCSLEEVDQDRLMVTGASGGGTQTMILAAADDRIDAAFPCVMPSTAMQGGCTCENTHYLRIGQGNMDIAGAVAPKPLGMTAADDWTVELQTKGHPDLLELYKQLKTPKNYEAHFDIHFKHNYNHVSRTHMYRFVNQHFGLGLTAPVLEGDHEFLTSDYLSVWSDGKPDGYKVGDDHERDLNKTWAELSDASITDEAAERAWSLILNRGYDEVGDATFELGDKEQRDGYLAMNGTITHKDEIVPASFYYPESWNGAVTIWLSRNGRAGLDGNAEVEKLAKGGVAVMGLDLFRQGEPDPAENPSTTYSGKKELEPDSWQRSPVYYYGYNDSIFVRRVHDILSAVKMARTHDKWDVKEITLTGDEGTGHWAAAAAFLAGDAINNAEAKVGNFTFGKLDNVWHEDFVPGAVKYGDVDRLLKLAELKQ